jgi:hypothetical protein
MYESASVVKGIWGFFHLVLLNISEITQAFYNK